MKRLLAIFLVSKTGIIEGSTIGSRSGGALDSGANKGFDSQYQRIDKTSGNFDETRKLHSSETRKLHSSEIASRPVEAILALFLSFNPISTSRFQQVRSNQRQWLDPQDSTRGRDILMQDDNFLSKLGNAVRDAIRGPRGRKIQGWQDSTLEIPNAISNSKVNQACSAWPSSWPYSDKDFERMDESDDSNFYSQPRLVTHIDDGYIATIKKFYARQFSLAPQGEYSVLDICSSWISHYPENLNAKRVAITGMEESELRQNSQATEFVAKDLNKDPTLPYGNDEFDFITNVVSVDYLTKPREIFAEMHRVMKPGGVAIMSFSNRCFPTKAIGMWVMDMNDGPGHCQIVGNYFRFNPEGGWREITALDLSPFPGLSDPVWVVTAIKA